MNERSDESRLARRTFLTGPVLLIGMILATVLLVGLMIVLPAVRQVWRIQRLEMEGFEISTVSILPKSLRRFQRAAWTRGWSQIQAVQYSSRRVSPLALRKLSQYPEITILTLQQAQLDSNGLRQLAPLVQLRHLNIRRNRFRDDGLVALRGMTNLQQLSLASTRISDAGIPHLAPLAKLESLDLTNTEITAACIPDLARLTSLKHLQVGLTYLTLDDQRELQRRLPRCQITASHPPKVTPVATRPVPSGGPTPPAVMVPVSKP